MSQQSGYNQSLTKLAAASSQEKIVEAIQDVAKLAADKLKAKEQVCLILVDKYLIELTRANENPMVLRTIKKKFNDISLGCLKREIEDLVSEYKPKLEILKDSQILSQKPR